MNQIFFSVIGDNVSAKIICHGHITFEGYLSNLRALFIFEDFKINMLEFLLNCKQYCAETFLSEKYQVTWENKTIPKIIGMCFMKYITLDSVSKIYLNEIVIFKTKCNCGETSNYMVNIRTKMGEEM